MHLHAFSQQLCAFSNLSIFFSDWQPIWKEMIFAGKDYITIARSYQMIGSDRAFLSFFREIISAIPQTVFPPIQL